jgi:hypothetical protein
MMGDILQWKSEKTEIRDKILTHYNIVITEQCVTRYQLVGLLVKTSSVTLPCLLIANIFYHLTAPQQITPQRGKEEIHNELGV